MASIASRNIVTESSGTEGLTSWWSKFKSKPNRKEPDPPKSIFSVPLHESITYANVAISLYNDDGQTFIYGYIPIVVAKCGLFLKDNATETEGIFRLSGSAKRIKDLQAIFDQPPKYGKGLDWAGFTVHDAANILRRYLNHLPDPIIPYDWYDSFREPLKSNWPTDKVIKRMQELVASLPPLNRQLLLYILDLLAVFASKCDINRMTSENLSAIFQPGLITHPRDDMAPQEYKLSQEVLVFLIDNQSHFLLDSLCSPATSQAQALSPSPQKKASVTRRRTLQAPRRSPSAKQSESPNGIRGREQGLSPGTTSSGTVSNLSRSNTVPSKRNPPAGTPDVNTVRYVSNPVVSRVPLPVPTTSGGSSAARDVGQTPPTQRVHTVASETPLGTPRSIPRKEVPSNRSRTPSHETPSSKQPVQNWHNGADIHSSQGLRLSARSNGTGSRRNSQSSSVLGVESEFAIISGRKGVSQEAQQVNVTSMSQAGDHHPLSISSAATNLGDKSSQNKQGRLTSSSPSKFSNLFKKKPRNQSVSSTSEAGGRRDLDK